MTSGSWPGSMLRGLLLISFLPYPCSAWPVPARRLVVWVLVSCLCGSADHGEASPGGRVKGHCRDRGYRRQGCALSPAGESRLEGMAAAVTIGEFSRITHLSIKTLRRYHEAAILEPAHVDRQTGYRYYSVDQVPTAQVIHRFRELGMPVREVGELVAVTDPGARAALI